ncbi:putative E3 ubiquitin-protein ligase xbat31 [Phtheirospermum japonicum]|uniref:Putative E3 ubiquitin-protein ligase xbat31 n=1 Tax=Phtheirospermum japonicum TaxID=374723 RepID=A0A830D6F8_9LAMI|nr:putative E3 ubiquitin-protein ligase xbat31 [Phtheirospermum japonicum]
MEGSEGKTASVQPGTLRPLHPSLDGGLCGEEFKEEDPIIGFQFLILGILKKNLAIISDDMCRHLVAPQVELSTCDGPMYDNRFQLDAFLFDLFTGGFSRFVNIRNGSGSTPLHLAARQRRPNYVRILLSSGALIYPGSTPLHLAARGGSLDCVRELLAWGADCLQRDSAG